MTSGNSASTGEAAAKAQLSHRSAVAVVFGSSAAVLVVEIVALRLLAPYLGLTLETSTLVIGMALTAIAAGSWYGGWLADRTDPRRLIAPALGVSGAVVALTPALLRTTAEIVPGLLLPVSAALILVPGAFLSAVTPLATKLRLHDLGRTGTVVGQLSGVSTLGAITGTVLTGFVLITRVPVSGILLGLGTALVAAALLPTWRRGGPTAVALVLTVGGGTALLPLAPGGCDAETAYHCAQVVADPERESGRTLFLDGVRHSYVDMADPTHLEFIYVRAVAAAIDSTHTEGEPLAAYHLGGGGLTIPRYLAETRPGTTSLVSEIDGGVVHLDREQLGLETGNGIQVRVEDGRRGLRRLPDDGRDVVVGDAFGGVSVPWHLTTREALREVRRVLREDGVYVANLIDHGTLDFARAEVATLAQVFDHVVVTGEPADVGMAPAAGRDGGNLVAVASDRPLDLEDLQRRLDQRDTGWVVADPAATTEWVGEAPMLTDDFAPVDQLLQPHRSVRR